jgi:hypothetical protein
VAVQLNLFLAWAVDGGKWLASRSGRLTCGEKNPSSGLTGECVEPRMGLEVVTKKKRLPLPGFEPQIVQP